MHSALYLPLATDHSRELGFHLAPTYQHTRGLPSGIDMTWQIILRSLRPPFVSKGLLPTKRNAHITPALTAGCPRRPACEGMLTEGPGPGGQGRSKTVISPEENRNEACTPRIYDPNMHDRTPAYTVCKDLG